MASRVKASASGPFSHSRTLFLQTDGVPLRFYIRPGPTKASLSPLISHGGGVTCRVEEPGAILLCDSEEEDCVPNNRIRAQFVRDCVQQNRQLDLADYRVARATTSTLPCRGRMTYSKREDVAILMYVREYGSADSVRGNALWREMERVELTQHPWQSMRNRYLRFLRSREQQYNLESRSVIPGTFREGAGKQPSRSEAGDKVSDGVNSEEEFNIFPIAIWEFENDEEQLEKANDMAAVENIRQGQQREMDKPAQVSLGEHCHRRKGVMSELNVENEQIETDETEEMSLHAPCTRTNGSTAKIIMNSQQMGGEDPLGVGLDDYHAKKKKETLSAFVMNKKQSELDSVDELSLPTASQDEVESATKAISIVMQTHNLDLCSATQLLLKNNGELAAALHFMETGHRPDGYPIWTHQDDLDLENMDSKVQEILNQKFGTENLAKRIAFRKN
ncbi:telomeric repeat-binding factor 2-interacting protein 1 isoform X2 [Narcine bancroftii]|uniref:telomeric repeat-binding factor 2-interacting protein 1 isoform X2 n=1 Tax=Narcine bancroftii TaxID=1343680 RepID=UPI003831A641